MSSLRDMVDFQIKDSAAKSGADGRYSFGGGVGSGMRTKVMIGAGLSLCCAVGAAVMANSWFESQYDRMRNMTASAPAAVEQVEARSLVVASGDVAYGALITRGDLKLIDWYSEEIPEGAFEAVDELFEGSEGRYALSPMTRNEPVLLSKVSQPGQRASVSAMLDEGMKAVTIRVDDVLGVAGLVHPGDRVDVLFTRTPSNNSRGDEAYTELLLRDVSVLALDQVVHEAGGDEENQAFVPRAVTVAVDVVEAQKVALAATTGKLYLALRHMGAEVEETMRRVTLSDLTARTGGGEVREIAADENAVVASGFDVRARPASSEEPLTARTTSRGFNRYVVVGVTRGLERSEYNVVSKDR